MNSLSQNANRESGMGDQARVAAAPLPEWWLAVPAEEKHLICTVMRMVRGLKRSQVPQVAQAAAKWERGLGCFIKLRLMHAKPLRKTHRRRWVQCGRKTVGLRGNADPTSCPSAAHNPPGVSPNPD